MQELLAEQQSVADTRLCAGCHDPVALLGGMRDGSSIAGDDLVVHEGVSCVACHSILTSDTVGNGGFTLGVPEEYLFAGETSGMASFVNTFLMRSYPRMHRETYGRALYEASEFCAACHKQTAEERGVVGHRFGDDAGADGRHRSHRFLGSNMYIPIALDAPGGAEQAALTASWLRGEIDIPEIADRWTDGEVVTIDIVAPEEIGAGELINLTLVLHNNKTGHDFPAGPLDILASWVELEVVDNLGRTVLHLGSPDGDSPTVDAPIVYKADWYDKRGLPVDRHEIWDVVGSSYLHAIESGDAEIVDVPFRCPAVARPRISESFSEQGPGERKSEVVMSIDNEAVTSLTVTARVLYRKVTPEFLRRTLSVETGIEAPTLVLSESTQTIQVNPD